METLVKRHCDILNVNNPENNIKLVVDEWGTWYNVEEGTNPGFLFQQNTMRDAMVASINLNISTATATESLWQILRRQ